MLDSVVRETASDLQLPTISQTVRRHTGGGARRIAMSASDVVITHGKGSRLFGNNGSSYLDFATAMGVAAIGHAHPRWVAAIREQSARLSACVLHTPQQAEYLQALAAVMPKGLDRIALYSGGAEAVEVALRLAQSYTGRKHIISFNDGFHGKTLGTRFAGRHYLLEQQELGIDWIHHAKFPHCETHNAANYSLCNDDGSVELRELQEYASQLDGGVAAIIVEPVLGTAGNRPPQRLFIKELARLCTKNQWLLIADESITGFGRLGTTFAVDYYDIVPDILVLGKAIGGGFPLSGIASSDKLWDNSLYAEMSATSSSYGANPLACAAGLAVLEIVNQDDFRTNVHNVSNILAHGLQEIEANSTLVRHTRGVGMLLGLDFVDPQSGALASSTLCKRLFLECLQRGLLIVGDVPSVRLNPTLILTPTEANQALEILADVVCG